MAECDHLLICVSKFSSFMMTWWR